MIDFIPVSEYAHYFDVTVLCMVLTAVWQCHTGSVLKKETVSLNAMWGVLFTLILILYMGLRPVSVYFGDTVNYAKGFYTAANSRFITFSRAVYLLFFFSIITLSPYCFTTLCNGLPDTATSILFSCYVPLFISVHCGWLCNVSSKGITIFLS